MLHGQLADYPNTSRSGHLCSGMSASSRILSDRMSLLYKPHSKLSHLFDATLSFCVQSARNASNSSPSTASCDRLSSWISRRLLCSSSFQREGNPAAQQHRLDVQRSSDELDTAFSTRVRCHIRLNTRLRLDGDFGVVVDWATCYLSSNALCLLGHHS